MTKACLVRERVTPVYYTHTQIKVYIYVALMKREVLQVSRR